MGKSHRTSVHKLPLLKRKEIRSGSNRGPSAYQPSALPLGHTGTQTSLVTSVLRLHKARLPGRTKQTRIPFFCNIYSCKWDQMGLKVSADARIDSVETSISSSVREALSFSTFRTSVGPLLKQWPTTGLRRHKLTSQSDSPCRQLRPLRQATSYSKTCHVLRLGKDLASTSLSLSEVAKGTSPKHFAQQNLRCTSTVS